MVYVCPNLFFLYGLWSFWTSTHTHVFIEPKLLLWRPYLQDQLHLKAPRLGLCQSNLEALMPTWQLALAWWQCLCHQKNTTSCDHHLAWLSESPITLIYILTHADLHKVFSIAHVAHLPNTASFILSMHRSSFQGYACRVCLFCSNHKKVVVMNYCHTKESWPGWAFTIEPENWTKVFAWCISGESVKSQRGSFLVRVLCGMFRRIHVEELFYTYPCCMGLALWCDTSLVWFQLLF